MAKQSSYIKLADGSIEASPDAIFAQSLEKRNPLVALKKFYFDHHGIAVHSALLLSQILWGGMTVWGKGNPAHASMNLLTVIKVRSLKDFIQVFLSLFVL